MKLKLISTLALAAALTAGSAQAITITTTGTTSGGSVSGTAAFTFGLNSVDITLTNLTNNPGNVAQLLAGLSFDVRGLSLTSSNLTRSISALSGLVEIITPDRPQNYTGAYNLITSGLSSASFTQGALSLDRWQASSSGSTVSLTALSGGNPAYLIIGNPDNNDLYSAANAGVRGDNPSALGAITAHISLTGVTSNSTLGNVTFQWGTSTTGNQTTVTPPNNDVPPLSTPDSGTTVLLLGGALVGVFLIRHSLRKSS